MLRFEVVHNIPSPYRLHLFRIMAKTLAARGVTMRVHFMARSHSDRPKGWAAVSEDLGFESVFHEDRGFRVGDRDVHWNPTVLRALRKVNPEWLMVGGPWDSLTGVLATVRIPRKHAIAWFETNTKTPGRIGFPFGNIKRYLLRRYQVYAVPGEDGVAYTRLLWGKRVCPAPVGILPNIIDETKFRNATPGSIDVGRRFFRSIGVPVGNRVAIWPARHIPEKGIPQMLRNLAPVAPRGWSVVLVGEGPLRDQIVSMISELRLGGCVIVVPSVDYSVMPSLYHASSLFMLPSMQDQNPLSVVEAMHAGLPLLISRRIGNIAEALQEGENGWAFDPVDAEMATQRAREAFFAAPDVLAEMGRRSKDRALRFWDSEKAVSRFLGAALKP